MNITLLNISIVETNKHFPRKVLHHVSHFRATFKICLSVIALLAESGERKFN